MVQKFLNEAHEFKRREFYIEYMSLDEQMQRNADDIRLLKSGLRTHDPEVVDIAFERLSEVSGFDIAEAVVMYTITLMVGFEGWKFVDDQDGVSPLLAHNLPNWISEN